MNNAKFELANGLLKSKYSPIIALDGTLLLALLIYEAVGCIKFGINNGYNISVTFKDYGSVNFKCSTEKNISATNNHHIDDV